MARAFVHPSPKDISLDGILYALSDPIRRNILVKLMGCENMNCSKAACPTLAPSTVSFHHKVLREAGLIRSEKRGVEVFNSVRQDELAKRFPGLLDAIFAHHRSLKPKSG